MDSTAAVHAPDPAIASFAIVSSAASSTVAPSTTVPPPPPGSVGQVIDESVHTAAAPALRQHVAWYSGYRQVGGVPSLHRGLPSPQLTLIFALDDPLTLIGHPDPRQGPADYDTLLSGLHSTPAIISQPGRQSGIQLALDPLSARALLGVPAGELAGAVIPADALLGRFCADLREQLGAAANWPDRFAAIDRALPHAARGYGTVPPEVTRAWRLLLATDGRIPVSALAREVGWSERHLSGRFRTEVGLSPKGAARVIRFDRACTLLATRMGHGPHRADETPHPHLHPRPHPHSASTRLADLAAECGYFDQAHLAREFRSLAGCSPSEWVAAEF